MSTATNKNWRFFRLEHRFKCRFVVDWTRKGGLVWSDWLWNFWRFYRSRLYCFELFRLRSWLRFFSWLVLQIASEWLSVYICVKLSYTFYKAFLLLQLVPWRCFTSAYWNLVWVKILSYRTEIFIDPFSWDHLLWDLWLEILQFEIMLPLFYTSSSCQNAVNENYWVPRISWVNF